MIEVEKILSSPDPLNEHEIYLLLKFGHRSDIRNRPC